MDTSTTDAAEKGESEAPAAAEAMEDEAAEEPEVQRFFIPHFFA